MTDPLIRLNWDGEKREAGRMTADFALLLDLERQSRQHPAPAGTYRGSTTQCANRSHTLARSPVALPKQPSDLRLRVARRGGDNGVLA